MCGVESAESAQDKDKWEAAVRLDVMLHAYMLSQSGIPMLYSGDEIGQLNDYSYKEDPDKAADSRYIHRGKFRWDLAEKRTNRKTLQGRIFTALHQLEQIRKQEQVFDAAAEVSTYDVRDDSVLCLTRERNGEKFFGIYNFADQPKTIWIEEEGSYTDLLTGKPVILRDLTVPGQGFYWVKK